MKHLHLVNPYGSVAMQRMVMPLLNELPALYYVSHSQTVDDDADLNFHVPWHTLSSHEKKGEGKHAILYTHVNPPQRQHLKTACNKADLVICMTFTGRKELVDFGVDPKKIWCVYSAPGDFRFRQKNIGIIGFYQPNGRKRQSIILDLIWQYDLSPYNFIIAGDSWQPVVSAANNMGVSAITVGPANDEQLANLYHSLDLLLVTGYVEGGPLPILEAMAAGVKVISPNFGYAADLLPPEQIYNTIEELIDILEDYVSKDVENHMLVRSWTWSDYAAEHALAFGRLLGEDIELIPERAASRYAQLLDIIDEIKPRSIVEIGTWNGHNARRMIQQASKYHEEIKYQGFDLFEEQTGALLQSELSKVAHPESVVKRILEATRANIELVKGNTRETLKATRVLQGADLYYIDGGHSEETIQNDWDRVSFVMNNNSVVVLDDYYSGSGKPDGMGCNKIIEELDGKIYNVTLLPVRTEAENGRMVRMVKVTKNAGIHVSVRERAQDAISTFNDAGRLGCRLSGLQDEYEESMENAQHKLERPSPALSFSKRASAELSY